MIAPLLNSPLFTIYHETNADCQSPIANLELVLSSLALCLVPGSLFCRRGRPSRNVEALSTKLKVPIAKYQAQIGNRQLAISQCL
jgi:hypothetical protein